MAYQIITLTMVVIAATVIRGQNQQDAQQQSGSCACPCNSGFLTVPPGPPGPPGFPGVTGPQGLTGPSGNHGIPGVQGQIGSHGLKGDKGDVGQGSKGQSGEPGQIGEPGIDGIAGPRGIPGKVGPRGIRGIQGPTGNEGQHAVKGDKGEAGTSYTVPPMSAFSVRRISTLDARSTSQIITYEVEDIDEADDFNPSSGVFTCSIQGLYYFSFTFLPYYIYNSDVRLERNGSMKAKILYSKGSHYVMQSQSVILSLQVGDEVALKAIAPTFITHSSAFTNIFNGYLIYAT